METELRNLFYQAVRTLGTVEEVEVCFPNMEFNPLSHKKYFKASILNADPSNVGVNGDEARYLWVGQVSIYIRDGIGEIIAMGYAEKIRNAFPRFHKFIGTDNEYRVEKTASIASPILLESWISVPVSFRIQTIH